MVGEVEEVGRMFKNYEMKSEENRRSRSLENSIPCRLLCFFFSQGIPIIYLLVHEMDIYFCFSTFISVIYGTLYISNNEFVLFYKVDYNVALTQIIEN